MHLHCKYMKTSCSPHVDCYCICRNVKMCITTISDGPWNVKLSVFPLKGIRLVYLLTFLYSWDLDTGTDVQPLYTCMQCDDSFHFLWPFVTGWSLMYNPPPVSHKVLTINMWLSEILTALFRFKVEQKIDLRSTLQELGIKNIFTNDADLSAMTGNSPLYGKPQTYKTHRCRHKWWEK